MNATTETRILLLVEDNPGDVLLVSEMLSEASDDTYRVVHVPRIADAVGALSAHTVDVVVLDLLLPDCTGVEGVRILRTCSKQIPIVVLTGSDDESLALACIDAGAQDYLAKRDVEAQDLRRAIGYAFTRLREAELRELEEILERYRSLSSASQGTTVTAALVGSGAICVRNPPAFASLVDDYYTLLTPYLTRETEQVRATRGVMEAVATAIGDATGGSRDLLDLHVAALDRAVADNDDVCGRTVAIEARSLALEMMGLLVDYYRVAHHRRNGRGAAS